MNTSQFLKLSFLFIFLSLTTTLELEAANVDTLSIPSPSMNKSIPTVVIIPDNQNSSDELPVVYLLHGYSDNYTSWVANAPIIKFLADQYSLIIVCPDGSYSWYWDSPEKKDFCYETFLSKELPNYIDRHYPTRSHPHARAIAGLSMGGHGALWNAIRHPDIYGAAGSMSGGVDIRPFPDNWQMKELLGDKEKYPERWEAYTVINQLKEIKAGEQAYIIDCGYNDFFYQANESLHDELLKRKIAHDYIIRPGGHNWKYWSNAIKYQMLFFNDYFKSKRIDSTEKEVSQQVK